MRAINIARHGRGALQRFSVGLGEGGVLEAPKGIHGSAALQGAQAPANPSSLQRDVNFSGSGFLCCYHLGVANALLENGVITSSSRLGGASGGSLVAASLASGVPIATAFTALLATAAECRQSGTVGKLDGRLERLLLETLPLDAAERCNGRLFIAVTRLRPHPAVEPELVSRFRGRGDLVASLLSSCFIPGYLAMRPSNHWRGGSYVDGGLRHVLPPLNGFLNVLCFPPAWFFPLGRHVDRKGGSLISPGLTPSIPYSFSKMLSYALIPPPEPLLIDLFHWGEAAGGRWLAAHRPSSSRL